MAIKMIIIFLLLIYPLGSRDRKTAREHLLQKNYKQALELYIDICSGTMDFHCYNEMGVVFLGMGNYKQAINHFSSALRIKQEERVMTNLARAYYLSNDIQRADKYYQLAYDRKPNSFVVAMNYAIYLMKTYEKNRAHSIFIRMNRIHSKNFFLHLYLGISYYLRRDYRNAKIHFSKGIELKKDYADLYYHRAVVYYVQRNYGRALSDLQKAKKINPLERKITRLIVIIRRKISY